VGFDGKFIKNFKIFDDATFAISTATVTVSKVISLVNSINKVF